MSSMALYVAVFIEGNDGVIPAVVHRLFHVFKVKVSLPHGSDGYQSYTHTHTHIHAVMYNPYNPFVFLPFPLLHLLLRLDRSLWL